MTIVTNYAGSLTSPACELGFFVRAETKVTLGEGRLWATGGLFNTSGGSADQGWLYDVYEASIGLQSGVGFSLGCLNALNFTYEPDRTPIEVINIADAPAYELAGEECSVSLELLQWNADVLALVIGSGEYSTINENNAQIRFGGGCGMTSRPMVIEGVNVSCNVEGVTSLVNGLEAFVITLYDCLCTSGMNIDFNASENNPISTEWQVIPVTTLSAGNRLGNIYLYAA